ncbi:leucyl-tRNA synthetase [Capsaspora owczarzaki ATCC 30864]|uniref:leucyl-tRNA synthetase n=1 Tax=Capsaspora owczarzaki (strain ATCC 30864) TaxID=595528 RepID=UPI0001FE5EF1|nr:leucyl-tRNA synthetase [Capsaspora owczarzaki ATCC 30864]|eukprot:XP_004342431.1 leucyl-tRNA synthetase [Capsaspora owczarzaki ATCC 30864]
MSKYTLIKLQLVEPLPESLASLSGRKVFLVAGTLRPETMYGQTNCWVKPTMQYGAYEVDATTKDVFICTERAALNLAYQDLSSKEGEAVKVGSVSGQDLVGRLVQAPLSKYGQVYVLPMLSIKEDKGTGIVTSVPSDSPDDYAALRDLRNKEAFRQKYGIKDEMVLPFEPVPIIRTPTMGDLAAVKACDEFKVASQNDAVQLAAAKEKVYREGFYEGVFIFGPHNGGKVQDVKPIVRQQLLDEKLAAVYYEPENKVMSRSGDECIVAKVDQWYLDYGMQSWKDQVKVALRQLETYNPDTLKQFEITVDWLHDWACSRSYGLGSRIPWDQTYLIESLSDSTIYMAYYTVAHLLQNGALYGAGVSPLGITPEQMTHEVWDYIFFSKSAFPASSAIPQATLDKLRHEFQYWYGFNLRSSGRDLVQNHLTFSLFNHVAIWPDEPERWPKSIRANGHILLNNEKMSKQTGNFMTLLEGLGKFSADAMRMTLADAGDTADDANFSEQTANASVLRLFTQCEWIQATIAAFPTMRDEDISSSFADRYLDTAINRAIALADEAYAKMNFREALILGHYELFAARDFYREVSSAPNRRVLERFLEVSSILIAPICPHYAEHVFSLLGRKTLAINAPWPVAGAVDELTLKMARYISTTAHSFRARAQLVVAKGNKGKGPAVELKNLNGTIFYAKSYPAWQEHVIKTVAGLVDQSSNKTFPADNKEIMGHLKIKETPLLAPHTKNVMPFVAQLKLNYEALGASALDLTTPFDELQLLNDFLPYLLRSSEVQNLAVKSADEADAKTRDSVTPGNPVVNFA